MKKVLIISGHPDLKNSFANKKVIEVLAEKLPDAEIRKLDELYPDYQFDVEAEHKAWEKADVIVMQFPFHWYSCPGILKLYIDKMMTRSWAYGSKGKALVGKKIIFSSTIGAPKNFYVPGQHYNHEPEEFFYMFIEYARQCNMDPLPAIFRNGMAYIPNVSKPEQLDYVLKTATEQAEEVIATIEKL